MRIPELSRRRFLGLAALIPALPAILKALPDQEAPESVLRYQEGTAIPRYHEGGIIHVGGTVTAPEGPLPGAVFFDTGEYVLKVYGADHRWWTIGPIRNGVIR